MNYKVKKGLMQLLSQIDIHGTNASIQLLYGDLTAIPKEHAADILVVSAYPGNYITISGTLMAALYDKGISVEDMAREKEVNLVDELGCWLSKPLSPEQQQKLNFRRILCFEPYTHTVAPETVVGNIFRCINTFAFDKHNNTIAMPVLASGNQKVPLEKMMPAIIDAAIFWLENGLPLDCIKLALYREEQVAAALPIFTAIKEKYNPAFVFVPKDVQPAPAPAPSPQAVDADRKITAPPSTPPRMNPVEIGGTTVPVSSVSEYDFFISYSHRQLDQVKEFVTALLEKNNSFNIFYDKTSIPPGGSWIRQISDAIQKSKAVVCILSPEYSKSDVCWDEFQCAKVMELRKKKSMIKTINFLNDENMPPMMAIYSYIDCTEGDLEKLKNAVNDLLSAKEL